jgi:signal transduction histidine kinase
MSEPPELDPHNDRAEVRRAQRRLAARSRELDALQVLGRRAAEARAPEELFAAVIEVVHRDDPLDLALVGFTWNGAPGLLVYLARPFDEGYLDGVVRRACRFLGWDEDAEIEPQRYRLDGFDPARGERSVFREEDLALLPLVRGARTIGCLLAVPAGEPDERRLRLLYNASNQLSLHLDRILRTQAAETDRFRAIVDAMPQGVLLTDLGLRILQANGAAERMLQAAGLPGARSLEAGLRQLGLTKLVEHVRDGASEVAEGEAHVVGDRIWSITVSALPGREGARSGLVFVLSDRTESRRLQQQLAQSETMSSLGQMISGVAHELNNPLASIIGYSQLMRGSVRGDEKLA